MSTYHWPADEIRYLAPVAGKGSTKIPVSRALGLATGGRKRGVRHPAAVGGKHRVGRKG